MKNCTRCNKEIELARLDALPDTEFCIKCAKQINIPNIRERFKFSFGDEPQEFEDAFE